LTTASGGFECIEVALEGVAATLYIAMLVCFIEKYDRNSVKETVEYRNNVSREDD
jgi:hypothetical protein